MYQISSFANSRFETMVNSALELTSGDGICVCCAEDAPTLARVIQGIPVRVCDQKCAVKLVDLWRTGPKVLKYNHIMRIMRLALDKIFGM